jgi:hypothetical protein
MTGRLVVDALSDVLAAADRAAPAAELDAPFESRHPAEACDAPEGDAAPTLTA